MAKVGSEALLAHDGEYLLTLLDIRNPQQPSVAETVELSVDLTGSIQTYGTQAAVGVSGGSTLLLDVIVPPSSATPLALGPQRDRTVQVSSAFAALGAGRLFTRGYDYLCKHDVRQSVDPAALMDELEPPYVGSYPMFLHDPDGPDGPQDETLFVGVNFCGFSAYAP